MNQKEIVKLIYKKDESSFAHLYDNYAKSLFGIISSVIKEREEAEKILTEVFEDVWNSLESFVESKGTFYTWLVEKTQNRIFEFLKNSGDFEPNQLNSFINLLDYENKPETIGIQEYVKKLKPRSIKIIDLLFFQRKSVDEVSQKLEISPERLMQENRLSIKEIRNLLEA